MRYKDGTLCKTPKSIKLTNGQTLCGDIPEGTLLEYGYLLYEPSIVADRSTHKLGVIEVVAGVARETIVERTAEEKIATLDRAMIADADSLLECLINKGILTGNEPEIANLMAKKAQKDAYTKG